jgi:hypothetical protein
MIGERAAPMELDEGFLRQIARQLRVARQAIQIADQPVEVTLKQRPHLVLK